LQFAGADFFLGLLNPVSGEDGVCGQIQVALQTAQFNGGESVLRGKFQNFFPFPGRTTERGKCQRDLARLGFSRS